MFVFSSGLGEHLWLPTDVTLLLLVSPFSDSPLHGHGPWMDFHRTGWFQGSPKYHYWQQLGKQLSKQLKAEYNMRSEKRLWIALVNVLKSLFRGHSLETHGMQFFCFWCLVPGTSQRPRCVVANAWQGRSCLKKYIPLDFFVRYLRLQETFKDFKKHLEKPRNT